MDPRVLFGQVIPGRQNQGDGGRPEGFLHVRPLINISQVLPLFPGPPHHLSPHEFMIPWLQAHVDFLLNSELGKQTMIRKNNIKDFYLMLSVIYLYNKTLTLNNP
jgi:hypothetical protein